MSLYINKEGTQLGPYSLEEARALVLAGQLDPNDWAWPDGASAWSHLKDVPGYASATPAPPVTTPASAAKTTVETAPATTAAAAAPATRSWNYGGAIPRKSSISTSIFSGD